MPKIYATARDGERFELDYAPGDVLMERLRDEGLDVEAACGGCCSCATCHVYVDHRSVGAPGDVESGLLSALEAFDPARSRLSCQIELSPAQDQLAVEVAPEE